jgi:hypothetical protein
MQFVRKDLPIMDKLCNRMFSEKKVRLSSIININKYAVPKA